MADVYSTKVTYLSKDQLVQMINDYTGNDWTGLGIAAAEAGYPLIAAALKIKVPPVIAAIAAAAVTLIDYSLILSQVNDWTTRDKLVEVLTDLVENYRQFTRVKVTVTWYEEFHVGPTLGYYTYYTTTNYEAVA